MFEIEKDSRAESPMRYMGHSTWQRKPDQQINTFSISCQSIPQSKNLMLMTDNQDNPPISITSLTVHYPVTRLIFKTSAISPVYLYFGNLEAAVPRYDLTLVGEKLVAAEKHEDSLANLEELKSSARTAFFGENSTSIWFWGVLALVVAGLLFTISRLLPADQKN